MTKRLQKTFDYSKTKWGIAEIKDYKTSFQGYEVELLIKKLGDDTKRRLKVLDLGCGGGNVCGFLKSKFPKWDIIGVDVSGNALTVAKKNFPKVKFIEQSVEKLDFKKESFDLILSLDTLEHFRNPKEVVNSASKLLKNDGIFFLVTPLEKQRLTFYRLAYKLGLDRAKRGSVGHINVFDDKEIVDMFKNSGFVKEDKFFGGGIIYTILDFGCFWLFELFNKNKERLSFESSLSVMKPGLKKNLIVWLKNIGSTAIYFENKLVSKINGGRCHYFFRKSDFFSINPPVTVCEDLQIKYGLKKVTRPKDVFVRKHLFDVWKIKRLDRVLDFGCAGGVWLERILKTAKVEGIGIDVSEKLIEFARRRKGAYGKYFSLVISWPLKKNYFDYCFSLDVFEHIKNEEKEREIRRIYASLKKGGKFLFYTLNPNNKYTFDWLFESLGSNFLYERSDHNKKNFISPVVFRKLLEGVGFRSVNYELFDGPFNLFWDVASYVFLSIFPFRFTFLLSDVITRIIYPINLFLDRPFTKNGYSNGYFIWGEK